MGELGDVFELVVTGPPKATPFFAECRRSFPRGGERRYRIWCTDAHNVREEGFDEGRKPVSMYVQAGSSWWHWHEARGAVTNTRGDAKERANSEIVWMLLAHGRLAVDPAAQIEGSERVADRDAILVRTPERLIAVDAEHGMTLRSVYRGNVIFEVDQVEFGVRVPPERFEFSPPSAVELRAASSDRPAPRPVAEVAAGVGFPVFEPGSIMLDWPIDAQPWLGRRGRPDSVTIRLRGAPSGFINAQHPIRSHSARGSQRPRSGRESCGIRSSWTCGTRPRSYGLSETERTSSSTAKLRASRS